MHLSLLPPVLEDDAPLEDHVLAPPLELPPVGLQHAPHRAVFLRARLLRAALLLLLGRFLFLFLFLRAPLVQVVDLPELVLPRRHRRPVARLGLLLRSLRQLPRLVAAPAPAAGQAPHDAVVVDGREDEPPVEVEQDLVGGGHLVARGLPVVRHHRALPPRVHTGLHAVSDLESVLRIEGR